MKTSLLPFVLLLFSTAVSFARNFPGKLQLSEGLSFTENKGQVRDQNNRPRPDVLYGAMTGNLTVHIKKSGVSYQLYKRGSLNPTSDCNAPGNSENSTLGKSNISFGKEKNRKAENGNTNIWRIDLTWLNANQNTSVIQDEAFPSFSNYYFVTCPNGALNVKSYKGITLQNLYNGISLHYYEKSGLLKHDYIIAPHYDYKQIRLKVEGASIAITKDGSLLLSTPFGQVHEGAPKVFQKGRELVAKWIVQNNILSFEVTNYDPFSELVIDPITRLWGTYYGGSDDEQGLSCATDAQGNVYLAGFSFSTGTMIATSGSHQTVRGGTAFPVSNAMLVKFDANGVRLWGTYYGGDNDSEGMSCAVDGNGSVFLCGTTKSISVSSVMASPGCHQSSCTAFYNGFLAKFNSSGVRQWGTFYSSAGERANACAVDASGNVYMTGVSTSTSNSSVVTPGAHQTTSGGIGDAYLVKFNTNGIRQWATYYGGTGDDEGAGCAVDPAGNIYLAGYSGSSAANVIATNGCHQPAFGGGSIDGFLAKFNASGVRQWGTYYGASNSDYGFSCATDANNNVYLVGLTESSGTTLATPGSHQSVYGGGAGGNGDGFLVKFNGNGVRQWGSYYGGSLHDEILGCATDVSGNLYVAGSTSSTLSAVFTTTATHQSVHAGSSGGGRDAFLAVFDPAGVRQWGTFYGGPTNDYGRACATHSLGGFYLAGFTNAYSGGIGSTAIASDGHQMNFGGTTPDTDAFLVKFKDCNAINPVAAGTSSYCSGANILLSVSSTNTPGLTYKWRGPATYTSALQNPTITNAAGVNAGIYTITVYNSDCRESATLQVTNFDPTITVNGGTICSGNSFTLVPNGAVTYTFSSGPVVSPTTTSNFSVTGTSASGCLSPSAAIASVTVYPKPLVSVNSGTICKGKQFTLVPGGASAYTIQGGVTVVSPTATSSYTVIGQSAQGCVSANTAIATVSVLPLPDVEVTSTDSILCIGESVTITASGALNYTFNPGGPVSSIVTTPTITTNFVVTGVDVNGCVGTTLLIQNVDECTSLKKLEDPILKYTLYPNPSQGMFTLELMSKEKIIIFNALGEIVFESGIANTTHQISLSEMTNGIYFIKINTCPETKTIKIIKN